MSENKKIVPFSLFIKKSDGIVVGEIKVKEMSMELEFPREYVTLAYRLDLEDDLSEKWFQKIVDINLKNEKNVLMTGTTGSVIEFNYKNFSASINLYLPTVKHNLNVWYKNWKQAHC